MKLLLVDDNDRIRKVMKTIYSPFFDKIIECTDGTEAVNEFKKSKPDWTVMDIKMKKMDGIEATTKIISDNPAARVIVVSQFNDASTVEAARQAGAIDFVSKENLYEVLQIINNHEKE